MKHWLLEKRSSNGGRRVVIVYRPIMNKTQLEDLHGALACIGVTNLESRYSDMFGGYEHSFGEWGGNLDDLLIDNVFFVRERDDYHA